MLVVWGEVVPQDALEWPYVLVLGVCTGLLCMLSICTAGIAHNHWYVIVCLLGLELVMQHRKRAAGTGSEAGDVIPQATAVASYSLHVMALFYSGISCCYHSCECVCAFFQAPLLLLLLLRGECRWESDARSTALAQLILCLFSVNTSRHIIATADVLIK